MLAPYLRHTIDRGVYGRGRGHAHHHILGPPETLFKLLSDTFMWVAPK